jgi:hypothetical protein
MIFSGKFSIELQAENRRHESQTRFEIWCAHFRVQQADLTAHVDKRPQREIIKMLYLLSQLK